MIRSPFRDLQLLVLVKYTDGFLLFEPKGDLLFDIEYTIPYQVLNHIPN